MSKKKKNGNKDRAVTSIVFVTAVLNLIHAVLDLIDHLTG